MKNLNINELKEYKAEVEEKYQEFQEIFKKEHKKINKNKLAFYTRARFKQDIEDILNCQYLDLNSLLNPNTLVFYGSLYNDWYQDEKSEFTVDKTILISPKRVVDNYLLKIEKENQKEQATIQKKKEQEEAKEKKLLEKLKAKYE